MDGSTKVGPSATLIDTGSPDYFVIHLTFHVVSGTLFFAASAHPADLFFIASLLPYFLVTLCPFVKHSHFLSFVLGRSFLITSTARAKNFAFLSCRQTLASRPPQPSRRLWLRESAALLKAAAAPQFPLYHFPFRLRCALAESRRASFIQRGLQSCAETSTK